MTEKEKQLFKALCKFKDEGFDEALLQHATPSVLGHLFFNRMQGIAYDTLKRRGMLGRVNREFRNSLASSFEQNKLKNQSFRKCIGMLSDLLATCQCKVAMLKGALLCLHYPEGYRTSNDIDLLVHPKDISTIASILVDSGFKQGSIRNGEFVPASRKEIIESKMLRGETVPYIKKVDFPFMPYLEVDINFSLDYKNGDADLLSSFMNRTITVEEKGIKIPTLDPSDFFIHLCAHLYKEATTLPWIDMHRDMTLYKYCDIYLLLNELGDASIANIFQRAQDLGLEKICAYAVLETMKLFDMQDELLMLQTNAILADDPFFCLRVVSPKDKKMLMYQTEDANERFFMESRVKDLEEVGAYA